MRTILVSAYGCEPFKGSEPGVGWNWVLQLAKHNYLHVITRANNKESIEDNLPQSVKERITFYYYDTPAIIRKLKHKDKGLYFYYYCWQIGIVPLARRILKANQVDYTMHLTFGSIWMPTFLPLLSKKFIWGPVGGGESVPLSFLKVLPIKQRVVQFFRYVLNGSNIINPLILLPSLKAELILARTPNTKAILPFFARKKTEVVLETAMESDIFEWKKADYSTDKIEMVLSGRLVSFKNIPTLIRALKYVDTDKEWKLTIIGSGPDLNFIKSVIQEENCASHIEIISTLPREEVLDRLKQSDIYPFPSLREGGTWALMEAMAIGVPVVCVNWTGMAVETDAESAIQLEVTNPSTMEREMGEAISKLINNPKLRERIGKAGRKRIKEVFNWEAKGEFMEQLFNDLDKR